VPILSLERENPNIETRCIVENLALPLPFAPRKASFFLPLIASSLFGLVSPFLVPSLHSRNDAVMGIGQKPAKRGTGRFFAPSLAKNTGPAF
jgi:hypothetical protein